MLSLRLVKSIVDVLEKLVLDLVDVLFGEQLGEHHRWRPHAGGFFFLNLLVLRGNHAPIWGYRASFESKVNLYVSKVLENMFNISSDLGPELINGRLFHQYPVAFLSRLVKFKFLVESSE